MVVEQPDMDLNLSPAPKRNTAFENYFVRINSVGKIDVALKETENSFTIYYFLHLLFNESHEYYHDFKFFL